jgi:hypothetical protein
MSTSRELAERTAALPAAKKLALAAELADKGHEHAALVIARAAVAEMAAVLLVREVTP